MENFFDGLTCYILPTGIGKTRLNLFKNQFRNHGGHVIDNFNEKGLTHVIVDDSIEWEKLCRIMKWSSTKCINFKLISTLWLINCLKSKQLVDSSEFEVTIPSEAILNKKCEHEDHPEVPAKKRLKTENKKALNDEKEVNNLTKNNTTLRNGTVRDKWICAHSSSADKPNYNKHITEKLMVLADTYKNTKDEWRALGYRKAITALSNHDKEITTWEEAKAIRGVGERLADKIFEIIQSGHLRKIDEVCGGERMEAVNLFTNLWGAGPTTAESWVQQGFRNLEDLRNKAKLTNQQKIGLKYYDELLERMPRNEAAAIEDQVRKTALTIESELLVMACGSYRRGKSTCGDVDVLITHPDGQSHKGIFPKILSALHSSNFLTDDLLIQENNGSQQKYLGVCMLPGKNQKHRRLDIIVVPYEEFACACMYFTGSAHFNRSMRHLAKKLDMSLSEHSLNVSVKRDGKLKLDCGQRLSTPSEESIFKHLKLPFRSPSERDH